MRPNVSAFVVTALAAFAYLAAVAVAGYVITAVNAAVEQWRSAGEITGPVISEAIGRTAPTASPWAWIAVDAAVLLLCWRAWGQHASGAGAPDRTLMLWVLAAVTGLQLAFVAATRLLDADAGWLVVPGRTQDGGLDGLGVSPTALVLVAVLHPVAVELLFRGVITDRMASAGVSVTVVVVWTALLYVCVQPTLPLAVLGAVFGLIAGVLRRRTASVAVAVAAHYALLVAAVVIWAWTRPVTSTTALIAAAAGGAALAGLAFLLADRRTRAAIPSGGGT